MREPLSEPENELFARWCRRSDARALGELFDAVAPRLLKLAVHLVGDAAEAEDLVQATFLTALERRESIDSTKPVMPWLAGVLAHKAQQFKRRAARNPEASRLALREVEDASRPLERRELDGEIARAIDGLGEPYRAVLVLRLRHGMEAADIAHVLERDPGTVRVQLHRGLEKLRAILPAALASSLVLGFLAPRGLAAVKAVVLQGATAAAVGGATSLSIGGWLVSKKGIAVAVALALAAAFWLRSSSGGVEAPRAVGERARAPIAEVPVSAPIVAPPTAEPEPTRAPAEREAVASGATGSLLRGRVIDAESKEPLAGASLRFFPPHESTAFELLRDWPELYEVQGHGVVRARTWGDWPRLEGATPAARFGGERLVSFDRPRPEEAPLMVARSDGAGGFALDVGIEGVLELSSPGYATRWRPVRALAEPMTIELWREREVEGVVVGPGGEPIAEPFDLVLTGSRGIEWKAPDPAAAEEGVRIEAAPILDDGDLSEAYGLWRVRTDETGRFRVKVGAPSVAVAMLTPGWGFWSRPYYQVDGEALTLNVFRIAGFHFFDAASGAAVERVRLLGVERANQYVRWSGEYFARGGWLAVSDDWSYATSEKGTLAFTVWSDGYAPAHVSIPDIQHAGTVEVPMEGGAIDSLLGRVTRGGEPVAGAEVVLLGHSPLQWRIDEDFYVDAARTAADGGFRLSAPSGSYILRVRADEEPFLEKVTYSDRPNTYLTRAIQGHEAYYQVIELPASAPLALDLAATSAIEVEIVDTLATPRREHVVALRADDGRQMMGYTDEQGVARFPNLPAGRFQLHTPTVNTRGSWADGVLRDVEVARASVERVRIELPAPTGPRHARVVARDTSSYAGWRARYDQEEWQELGADGTVPMDLTTDRFELEVAATDRRHWHLLIPKEAPDGAVIELDGGNGRYRGVLRQVDGSPWPDVRVHATPWTTGHGQTSVSCVTDERGEFELGGLGPSEHRLRFQTCLTRSVWDDAENRLANLSFAPAAPPSEDGTWLEIQVADVRAKTRLTGTVVDAGGSPVADALLIFEGEQPIPDGRFVQGGRDHFTHSDEHGAFELELPRTPTITVSVYPEKGKKAALTQTIEPTRDEESLRLVVP